MEDLIKAFLIFLQYGNPGYPTTCEHDQMFVNIDPRKVSEKDIKRLEELGFFVDEDANVFSSFRFG